MEIKIYIHDNKNKESTNKILTLLKDCELEFAVEMIDKDVANIVGEKVKKLPHVVIDGERVGGYYDLVEYLMNKNIINYAGEPKWKTNN